MPWISTVARQEYRTLIAVVLLVGAPSLGGCRPSLPGNESSEAGPDLGSASECGNGDARPGKFCFDPIPIADGAEPILRRASVASTMTAGSAEILMIHSVAGPSKLKIVHLDLDSKTATVSASLDNGITGHRLFLVDLDGDGDTDLLESSYSSTFGVFWRQGQTYGDIELVDLNLEGAGHALPIDVDADGVPEILKAHRSYGEIGGRAQIFHYTGDDWAPGQEIDIPGCGSLGANGGVLALAKDLNGDDVQDLVLAGDPIYSGEQLDCEHNLGLHHVFVQFTNPDTGQLGAPVVALADQRLAGIYVGDVDGDGYQDVARAPYEGGNLAIARGTGNAFGVLEPLDLTLDPNESVFDLPMLADLDGDGRQEFCLGTEDGLSVLSLGDEAPAAVSFGAPLAHLENLGDLNGDEIDDFIADLGGDGPYIFLSNP